MILKKGVRGENVLKWQRFLILQGYTEIIDDGIFGENTSKATIKFQISKGIIADGIVGPKTFSFLNENNVLPVDSVAEGVTIEQLAYIMKGAKYSRIEEHFPYCNECMKKFEINTNLRKQHFLAQVGHESASLTYMHEIASGAAYEGRLSLGNTQPGDGKRFRGHGPIQLTGRTNHEGFFKYIGHPEYINDPKILETDYSLAWQASGWYWTVLRNINRYADRDNAEMVTKQINGGLNGYSDRLSYLQRAKEIIK